MQVESWAFSVDLTSLELLIDGGIFSRRTCKLCDDEAGIVVGGEYGLSRILLGAGYNIATLMSR